MVELACQISGIVKSFGPNQVLKEVDLELPSAAVTVLMGANGAGKSTLVKILCGVHKADAGSVSLFGKNLMKMKFLSFFNFLGVGNQPMG